MNGIRINTLARESKAEALKIAMAMNDKLDCDYLFSCIQELEACENVEELGGKMISVANSISFQFSNTKAAKDIEAIAVTVYALGHLLNDNKESGTL